MHLATASDIRFVNEVMNHPRVRPHIWPGDGPVDATEALGLMWTLVVPNSGVMMAEALGGNAYLGLTAFLPSAWGPEAVGAMRQAIRKLFTDTDCTRLYGSVKPNNLRASRNLVGLGFKEVGLHGCRVTGYIDYMDLLDEDMFKATVLGGWPGKALYWWGVKAKIEDIPEFVPLHPTDSVFMYKDDIIDLMGVCNA